MVTTEPGAAPGLSSEQLAEAVPRFESYLARLDETMMPPRNDRRRHRHDGSGKPSDDAL